MPTEQCNFRCFYCYERFKLNKMKQSTVNGIKALLKNRIPDLKVLEISWFGGEPLLGYDIITDVMKSVQESACKNKRLTIIGEMVTNGYLLTKEHFEELIQLGITYYQITFDGDKEEHDKLRVRADDGSTFDRIWGNLLSTHKSDLKFDIQVRLHANSGNYRSMLSFIQKFADSFESDNRYRLFIRPISKMGGINDDNLPILTDLDIIKSLRKRAKLLGLRVREPSPRRHVCFASRLNSFVIRSDGTLSKCEAALYNDLNSIGKLTQDGELKLNEEKLLWWSRGLFNNKEKDLACPLGGIS